MGNKLTAKPEPRESPPIVKPSAAHLKRRSRSQSEGVTSDCGTTVSTTDSQLPRGSNATEMPLLDPTQEETSSTSTSNSKHSSSGSSKTSGRAADQARRIREAERILLEIANEYAAKRAAGLVPTKPVPARTLLWEEMERRAQRVRSGVGRRGTCVFGRDTDDGPCGCSNYKKKNARDAGGVCECCSHGAPWHRLAGGTMAAAGSRSRGRSRTSSRNSQTPVESSMYSLGSDYYDEYDAEYDSDEDSDEDDEDIANEVARPYGVMDDPTPPLMHSHARSEGDALDRSSLFSNGDSFGLPPRLSSTSRHLDKLLSAIAKYRKLGMSEDEIETKIREDFPPTERLSYAADVSSRSTRASR